MECFLCGILFHKADVLPSALLISLLTHRPPPHAHSSRWSFRDAYVGLQFTFRQHVVYSPFLFNYASLSPQALIAVIGIILKRDLHNMLPPFASLSLHHRLFSFLVSPKRSSFLCVCFFFLHIRSWFQFQVRAFCLCATARRETAPRMVVLCTLKGCDEG